MQGVLANDGPSYDGSHRKGVLMTAEQLFAYVGKNHRCWCSSMHCDGWASWMSLVNRNVLLCSVCYVGALQELGIAEGLCEMCMRKYPLHLLPSGVCVDVVR